MQSLSASTGRNSCTCLLKSKAEEIHSDWKNLYYYYYHYYYYCFFFWCLCYHRHYH